MTLQEFVEIQRTELARQWVEDQKRKASITDAFRYLQLVAHWNGLAACGVIPDDAAPSDVIVFLNTSTWPEGFPGVLILLNDNELAWDVTTWPVAYPA